MPKATTETARKMLQLVNLSTDQGKLTWFMICFLHQTRAGFSYDDAPSTRALVKMSSRLRNFFGLFLAKS